MTNIEPLSSQQASQTKPEDNMVEINDLCEIPDSQEHDDDVFLPNSPTSLSKTKSTSTCNNARTSNFVSIVIKSKSEGSSLSPDGKSESHSSSRKRHRRTETPVLQTGDTVPQMLGYREDAGKISRPTGRLKLHATVKAQRRLLREEVMQLKQIANRLVARAEELVNDRADAYSEDTRVLNQANELMIDMMTVLEQTGPGRQKFLKWKRQQMEWEKAYDLQ